MKRRNVVRGLGIITITFGLLSGAVFGQGLRLIGTNLYYFSAAAGHEPSPYLLAGHIAGTISNGIILRSQLRYKFTPALTTAPMDSAWRAHYNYGYRISGGGKRTISYSECALLPEEFQDFFCGVQPPNITLLNYRADRDADVMLRVCAVPLGGNVWDCGKPITADYQTNFHHYYEVLPKGIVRVPLGAAHSKPPN
jgi:hypothetical protein